jgi:hypothetical protein
MTQTLPTFPGLAFPITRSNRGFGVVKQESISGNRTRFPQRSKPQYTWTLSFNFLRDNMRGPPTSWSDGTSFSDGTLWAGTLLNEIQQLNGFYNQMLGTTLPFLYVEPSDCSVATQVLLNGDGSTASVQLFRTLGGFSEPVYAPTGGQLIQDNVVLSPSAYTVTETGLITFAFPPPSGSVVLWTGTYAWRCRFDDDNLDFENFMSKLWAIKKLTFSSEVLP